MRSFVNIVIFTRYPDETAGTQMESSPKNCFFHWSVFLVTCAPAGSVSWRLHIFNEGEQKLLISTNKAYKTAPPEAQHPNPAAVTSESDIFLSRSVPSSGAYTCLELAGLGLDPFVALFLRLNVGGWQQTGFSGSLKNISWGLLYKPTHATVHHCAWAISVDSILRYIFLNKRSRWTLNTSSHHQDGKSHTK